MSCGRQAGRPRPRALRGQRRLGKAHAHGSRTKARRARPAGGPLPLFLWHACADAPDHGVARRGCRAGGKLAGHVHGLYEVSAVLEKPTPTEAEQKLDVPGLRAGHYLCFFGMHVLTPLIMELLAEDVVRAASWPATSTGFTRSAPSWKSPRPRKPNKSSTCPACGRATTSVSLACMC